MASPVNYEFVDKVPEDNICSICTNILTDPVLVECCGQLFCENCLNKWLQKQKTCPHCRKENFNFIKNLRMKRILDSSKIYCPNRSKGCDKMSTASKCNTHLETCLFVEVTCTNNCGARMTRKELQNHTTNECPKRKVNCQYCKEEGMYKDITAKDHIDKCPSLPLDCPNNCGHGKIQRKDLSDHQKECPLEPVKCPFFEAGCKQEMPRKELAAHKASNTETHLEVIMINTQRQLETMTQTARATQEKLETMTQTARATQEKLVATQVELKQLTLKLNGLAMCAMATMLEQDKQYCLPLVKCDEVTTRSPSFYIHPGYKMYLTIDERNECELYLEKGEHDDKLEWPISGMDIELASMDNKLIYTIIICTRCGRTVNREGDKAESGKIQGVPHSGSPQYRHPLGDSVLLTIQTHSCYSTSYSHLSQ